MPRLVYTASYIKRAKKFVRKHPELLKAYQRTLELLELNPYHPALKLHQLQGKLSELHAVSIPISYRITLYFMIREDQIIPVDVGAHDEVY